MILLARLLARLLGIALVALLALAGLAAAVFGIQGGHRTLSLAALAGHLRLPQLRADTGRFLTQLTAPGPVALVAAVCGAGAVLLGLVLLLGAWTRPRPRRIVLARTTDGSLGALRRPLSRTLTARLVKHDEVQQARTRARPRRRGAGGRIRVTARAAAGTERRQARTVARAESARWLQGLPLQIRVSSRRPSRSARRRRRNATRGQEATP